MKGKVLFIVLLAVTLVAGLNSVSYPEEKFPDKPVQLIIANRAGGGVDLFFRLLAEELKKVWKVNVNVENQPSAGGIMAANTVMQSKKDGNTVVGIILSVLSTPTAVKPDGPVNLTRDFEPIMLNPGYASVIYLVRSDSKFKTLKDVFDYAKTKPGELICGTGPRGITNYLVMEVLKRLAKVDITTLAYEGSQEVIPQLLGGHIQIGAASDVAAKPYIDSGRLRALVVDVKSPVLPDVPTLADLRYPEANLYTTIALLGPKGLSPAAANVWQSTLRGVVKDPNFIAALKKVGLNNNVEIDPAKMREFMAGDVKRYSQFTPEELGLK